MNNNTGRIGIKIFIRKYCLMLDLKVYFYIVGKFRLVMVALSDELGDATGRDRQETLNWRAGCMRFEV